MSKTPEERAEFLAERLGRYSAGWLRLKQIVCIDAMRQQKGIITAEIRAAVAAETERCAKDPEMLVSCTDCGAQVGSGCVDTDPDGMGDFIHASHDVRWEAAIRAEPDAGERATAPRKPSAL